VLPDPDRSVQGIPRGGGPEAGDARATRKNVRGHGTGRADEGKGQGVTMAGDLIRREALERIIQRAAELQAGEQDIGEGLTEPELLALGQDVGIPSRYLRQALLEERTRPPVEARGGLLAWLVGPGRRSRVASATSSWSRTCVMAAASGSAARERCSAWAPRRPAPFGRWGCSRLSRSCRS